jgi:predicted regulator of amino acid metabolism with ACT domain
MFTNATKLKVNMEMKEQCKKLNISLSKIANELGYSRQYVQMVVAGNRQNNKITTAVYLALEARKSELRKLIG